MRAFTSNCRLLKKVEFCADAFATACIFQPAEVISDLWLSKAHQNVDRCRKTPCSGERFYCGLGFETACNESPLIPANIDHEGENNGRCPRPRWTIVS